MEKCRFRLTWGVALLALGSACRPLTASGDVLPVEFVYGVQRLQTEPAFMVDTQADAVSVRGYLSTPCQPYAASATAEAVGSTLVLRVIGKATGDCPQDAVLSVGYQATVRTMTAGYDRLRVVHEWRDAAWPADAVVSQPLGR